MTDQHAAMGNYWKDKIEKVRMEQIIPKANKLDADRLCVEYMKNAEDGPGGDPRQWLGDILGVGKYHYLAHQLAGMQFEFVPERGGVTAGPGVVEISSVSVGGRAVAQVCLTADGKIVPPIGRLAIDPHDTDNRAIRYRGHISHIHFARVAKWAECLVEGIKAKDLCYGLIPEAVLASAALIPCLDGPITYGLWDIRDDWKDFNKADRKGKSRLFAAVAYLLSPVEKWVDLPADEVLRRRAEQIYWDPLAVDRDGWADAATRALDGIVHSQLMSASVDLWPK